MTDDLVNKLRTTKLFEAGEWESGLGLEAADRIERDAATIARLEGERDEARETLRMLKVWDFPGDIQDANCRAEAAEAKVAALVEALEKITKPYAADQSRLIHSEAQIASIARAAIAAAKGGA